MPIQNKSNNEVIVPPPLDSRISQEIEPQVLTFVIKKSKESFIKKHKTAIIALGATVLAAGMLGAVAFFAWPAVAAAILSFGAYGLTLGALAGANLIAQVGVVAAVSAVGGFIASSSLAAVGPKLINGIKKAWNALYESPVEIQIKPTLQADPAPQSLKPLKTFAETVRMLNDIKAPAPSLVAPPKGSCDFLRAMEEKKMDFRMKWEQLQGDELEYCIDKEPEQKTEMQPCLPTNKFKQIYQTMLTKGEEALKMFTQRAP
ncbi:transmembrane protein [Legionella gratiana]|uniref:Transmembrane protein n=1 Tax=Legionella gratiana TaxID=45066 RepID=A0A378JAD9_9GAMM|nr:hypothetical protein [Legionella gratiana]KTD11069.1 transmembrane protein [Legionella gratiana]STX44575.1 transmembrane protein [Legionella gratiana]